MKIEEQEIKKRLDRFKNALNKTGVRMTPQRAEIFREIARTDDHPDAESVYERVRKRLPSISLDTVYRTLRLFEHLKLVSTLTPSLEAARFDANMDVHHHFICSKCGEAADFSDPAYDNLKIPDSVREFGFPERVHVELLGICRDCLKNRNSGRRGVHHHGKERTP